MTSDEFEALPRRDRTAALRAYFEAWPDANSESRQDTIDPLASLVGFTGLPRIEVGDDEALLDLYNDLVGNYDDIGDPGLTDGDRQAAYEAVGYGPDDLGDDQIESCVETHEGESLAAMHAELTEKVAAFERAGGRGIELADEIDALRIAIAIRRARVDKG